MDLTAVELAQQISNNGPEILAFRFIDGLGAIIWRLNHDMADERIPKGDWANLDASIKTMQEAQKIIFDGLTKYGLKAPLIIGNHFSPEYWSWYHWWKNYIDRMPADEYHRLCAAEGNKEDLSSWRPIGTWQEKQN